MDLDEDGAIQSPESEVSETLARDAVKRYGDLIRNSEEFHRDTDMRWFVHNVFAPAYADVMVDLLVSGGLLKPSRDDSSGDPDGRPRLSDEG